MKKWASKHKLESNELFMNIQYYDLIYNTDTILNSIVDFTNTKDIAHWNLSKYIPKPMIKNHITDFVYYDIDDLFSIEKKTHPYIEQYNIRRIE